MNETPDWEELLAGNPLTKREIVLMARINVLEHVLLSLAPSAIRTKLDLFETNLRFGLLKEGNPDKRYRLFAMLAAIADHREMLDVLE